MQKPKPHHIGKEREKGGKKGTKQRPAGLERTVRKKEKIWKKVLTKGIRFDIIAKLT